MERKALSCLRWGVIFTFVNVQIGRLPILPDFVGMLLFYASIQLHKEPTEVEKKLKPLLLILAADYFLHWIWQFENGIEGLLALVIQIYVIFVLFGEVAGRIRVEQPDRAKQVRAICVYAVLVQAFAFFVMPYRVEVLNTWTAIAVVVVCILLMVVLFQIRAEEEA